MPKGVSVRGVGQVANGQRRDHRPGGLRAVGGQAGETKSEMVLLFCGRNVRARAAKRSYPITWSAAFGTALPCPSIPRVFLVVAVVVEVEVLVVVVHHRRCCLLRTNNGDLSSVPLNNPLFLCRLGAGGPRARGHLRLELRRIRDRNVPVQGAEHLPGWCERGSRDGVGRVRHPLHGALHGHADGEPEGLQVRE